MHAPDAGAPGSVPARTATIGPGRAVLAFDVGGTDIKSALFDATGASRGLRRTPTPAPGPDGAHRLVDRVAELAEELRAQHPDAVPEAVGLVVPGIVDADEGVAVFSSNLDWRDVPLRALMSARFGVPVAFDHDVRAAGWAERRLGAARESTDAVMLIIGTGIAGALLIDGRMHAAGGYAGEIGHAPIGDWPCSCGARGCLEAVASAGAIARRYTEAAGTAVDGARGVIALAAAGEGTAARIWEEALDALALALAQLTAVLAPRTVVIGGGLSRAGDALFAPLRARLAARLSFHRLPDLVPAELSEDAGLLGSALLARDALT
ncbi:ROK family protein [Microbacterium soli]|uniref:ROK family protein n=1 Tax=Microbacterium soli TaxID=446075 RepID=A0ABP7N0T0_9MICO